MPAGLVCTRRRQQIQPGNLTNPKPESISSGWNMAVVTCKRRRTSYFIKDCADWRRLPLTAISFILNNLLELIDHLRFAAVCKDWGSLAKEYNHSNPRWHKDRILPMLMIPTEEYQEKTTKHHRGVVYSISEGKIYNNIRSIHLPRPLSKSTRYCFGTGHGWLATVDLPYFRDFKMRITITLLNPFKAVPHVHLPPLDCIPHMVDLELQFVPRVILSADPILNPYGYMAIAFYSNDSSLAFIKRGQDHWTCIRPEPAYFFADVIFYRGQVYAVENSFTMIMSFNVKSSSFDKPSQLQEANKRSRGSRALRAYLVESTEGDLLYVRRFFKPNQSEFERGLRTSQSFKVYKLLINDRREGNSIVYYVEVKSIGDEALFLGDNKSVAVLASNIPGCKPNSIYYTDDSVNFKPILSPDIKQLPWDMGVYNLEDGTVTQHYPGNLCSPVSPALWITPPFKPDAASLQF